MNIETSNDFLQFEIKAQIILIKKLWSEILSYHKDYEKETMQLVDELKYNLEKEFKTKIFSESFNLKDSQSHFSEIVQKKEQTIAVLVDELEKINTFVQQQQNSYSEEITNLKEILDKKELEILQMKEKMNEYESLIENNKSELQLQAQKFQELIEKNALLKKELSQYIELMKNSNPHSTTPYFKGVEESELKFTYEQTNSILNNKSTEQRTEKEKNAKSVKFNDLQVNMADSLKNPKEIKIEDIPKNKPNEGFTEKTNEKQEEIDKKKYINEIKRLKEKIANLMIERENLIWSENQAVKQLQEFQIETGKLNLLLKSKNKETNSSQQKIYKKSQTMQLPSNSDFQADSPKKIANKSEELKLVNKLKGILGLVDLM